jgi:hypothetical protein
MIISIFLGPRPIARIFLWRYLPFQVMTSHQTFLSHCLPQSCGSTFLGYEDSTHRWRCCLPGSDRSRFPGFLWEILGTPSVLCQVSCCIRGSHLLLHLWWCRHLLRWWRSLEPYS